MAVVVRASAPEDLVHREEIAALVEGRGGRAYAVVGPRHKVRFDCSGASTASCPISRLADVYICGPSGFTDDVVSAALSLGVLKERIHKEGFGF